MTPRTSRLLRFWCTLLLAAIGNTGQLLAQGQNPYWINAQQLVASPNSTTIDSSVTFKNQVLTNSATVRMYTFWMESGQRVSFNISDTAGLDSLVRLFDFQWNELARNDNGHGPGPLEQSSVDSYLEYASTLSGQYYLSVSAKSNNVFNPQSGVGIADGGSKGTYSLTVSPGLSGIPSTGHPVDFLRLPYQRSREILTNRTTWVVIHGWNSSRTNQNISDLASTLVQVRPDDQILTLDWSAGADTGYFGAEDAAGDIVPTAVWAAAALTFRGIPGTNLNLVAHSFGAYVADEIAKRIPGGVHSIVALDPAANVASDVFDPVANDEVDFSRDSQFSWAFHSSSAGNEYTPVTADESFIADSGASTETAHSNVVELLAWLWEHPDDLFGRMFTINSLLADNYGPWKLDQYSSFFFFDDTVPGYDAIIRETKIPSSPTDNSTKFAVQYVPQDRLTSMYISGDGTNITVGISNGGWGTFVLETSADLKHWTPATNPVVLQYFGGATTFAISSNIPPSYFYRLTHSP